MTFRTCSDEVRLLSSARAGALSSTQRAHLASCPSCAEALKAERAMGALSDALAAQARSRLAPAEVVLLRARLRARREAAERSLRPLEIWQRFAAVAVAIGLLVGLSLSGSLFGALANAPGRIDPAQLLLVGGLAALAALPFVHRARSFA